jgi:diguanylate cyclase (GGDEF)-like protein
VSAVERRPVRGPRRTNRLGRIRPHRQVPLLGAITIVIVAVIVAAVISALEPTHRSLANAGDRLVPAMRQIDEARRNYNETAAVLQETLTPDPAARAGAINELTALNSAGEAAWRRYRTLAAGLPGERGFQRTFERNRQAALDAGALFVTSTTPSAAQLAAVTVASNQLRVDLNAIKELYEERIRTALTDATDDVRGAERQILLVALPLAIVLLVAFTLIARSARAREQLTEELDRALKEDAARNELETRLQRSLEMARDENAAFALVGRALARSAPDNPAELLVADSSRAHFRQAVTTDDEGGPGCPVMTPHDCPASTWGQTQIWTSSQALDACPYLQNRATGACSAVCAPVSISGNTIGVVHTTGADGDPPGELIVSRIELVARKVGERVGMLRAFARSETQAHTDPLTGLLNRRSLEDKVRALIEGGHSYAIAYGDLDHFKQLNDVHGHDAGDQALRLFARVMRDSVRPEDLTARWGGEEFVVVLPDCSVGDAYSVINRLRERLERVQAGSHLPRFTASFGVTVSRPEDTFSQSLELADGALLKAKSSGRDRIVIAGESDVRAPSTKAHSAVTNGG